MKEIKGKMLTGEQAQTVKTFIIESMKEVYTAHGVLPDEGFYSASSTIADKIIKNTQMALVQGTVFGQAVKHSKPIKKVTKKHARK